MAKDNNVKAVLQGHKLHSVAIVHNSAVAGASKVGKGAETVGRTAGAFILEHIHRIFPVIVNAVVLLVLVIRPLGQKHQIGGIRGVKVVPKGLLCRIGRPVGVYI